MRQSLITIISTTVAIAEAAASSGCKKTAPYDLNLLTQSWLESGGINRTYVAHLPCTYDTHTATPLILSFHGNNRIALNQASTDFLYNETWNTNSIVVYPQSDGLWQNVPGHNATTNDLAFTSHLLDKLFSTLCVDKNRVYATGKSDGGGFCNMLACDHKLSASFAAIAPVSGAMYTTPANVSFNTSCKPSHIMPVIEFHGLNDGTINYTGGLQRGVNLPSIPHWTKEWAVADGCSNTTSPNVTYFNSSITEKVMYSCGGKENIVQHWAFKNLEHDWPATAWNFDNKGKSSLEAPINASIVIMDFFANWTLEDTMTA